MFLCHFICDTAVFHFVNDNRLVNNYEEWLVDVARNACAVLPGLVPMLISTRFTSRVCRVVRSMPALPFYPRTIVEIGNFRTRTVEIRNFLYALDEQTSFVKVLSLGQNHQNQ